MAIKPLDTARLLLPAAGALVAWLVACLYVAPGVDLDAMTRGLIGPVTWPRTMLYCTGAFSAAIFVRNLYRYLTQRKSAASQDLPSALDERRATIGVALVITYAAALPFIGVAWATLAFLSSWMVLGGLRRPGLIAAVACSGTLAILYLFVMASHMPLDRGIGAFEQATVELYRALRIY